MEGYPYNPIEAKWRRWWEEHQTYQTDLHSPKPKRYVLVMFSYPSEKKIHIGHWWNYSGADCYARLKRMQGSNVFEPMGFDAFGLPAENYAIKHHVHPAKTTRDSVGYIREQLKAMGAMYDWSREVDTTDPRYYKWTQWIFIQLFKGGLAYRAKARVNWCPKDLTVLADEQVIDGKCERCSAVVVKRELEQWFFRITQYAERLLDHSKAEFIEITKTLQRNWIGKSEGAEVTFPLAPLTRPSSVTGGDTAGGLRIYTTRPDTLWGATFMVLAPEHPLVAQITTPDHKAEVEAYIAAATRKTDIEREDLTREKTGVFSGAHAVNPVNGERIPIWIADYVLMTYGTGAIMAVPAHDPRDFEFARKYGLAIRVVIQPTDRELDPDTMTEAWPHEGVMVRSGPLDGTPASESVARTIEWLTESGIGHKAVRYRLRDWLISRQRYWGPPIPMIFCEKDGWRPVPEDQLPVLLPLTDNFRPTGTGQSPLASISEFVNTTCPACGGAARRETDVSDNFLDSAWYFIRYLSTEFDDRAWDIDRVKQWLPVTHYMGGIEHSTLHHLYARFIWKAMIDLGHLPREVGEEPFKQLRLHGWITRDGAKMSKSRGNVVNPDVYVRQYGADVTRGHVLFMGAYTEGGDWRDAAITGIARFYRRVWEWVTAGTSLALAPAEDTAKARRILHKAIQKVGADLPTLGFNTAIATLMETLNALRECRLSPQVHNELARTYALLLAPIAPFLAEELWERLGGAFSVHQQPWPQFDPALVAEETMTIPVQVNGKLRDRIEVLASASEDEITRKAQAAPNVQRHIEGRQIVKTIYAAGKLLNIVVR